MLNGPTATEQWPRLILNKMKRATNFFTCNTEIQSPATAVTSEVYSRNHVE